MTTDAPGRVVTATEAAAFLDMNVTADPDTMRSLARDLATTVVVFDRRIAFALGQHQPADYDPQHCVTCLESVPCTTRTLLLGVTA